MTRTGSTKQQYIYAHVIILLSGLFFTVCYDVQKIKFSICSNMYQSLYIIYNKLFDLFWTNWKTETSNVLIRRPSFFFIPRFLNYLICINVLKSIIIFIILYFSQISYDGLWFRLTNLFLCQITCLSNQINSSKRGSYDRKRPADIHYLDRNYFPGLWRTQCKIRKQNLP